MQKYFAYILHKYLSLSIPLNFTKTFIRQSTTSKKLANIECNSHIKGSVLFYISYRKWSCRLLYTECVYIVIFNLNCDQNAQSCSDDASVGSLYGRHMNGQEKNCNSFRVDLFKFVAFRDDQTYIHVSILNSSITALTPNWLTIITPKLSLCFLQIELSSGRNSAVVLTTKQTSFYAESTVCNMYSDDNRIKWVKFFLGPVMIYLKSNGIKK